MEKQSYKSIGSNGSAMCVGPVGWAFDTKNDIMNAAKVSADLLQTFFTTNLRTSAGQEYEAARDYAYSRWPEDFCSEAGIGYAPSERQPFEDYCRQKGINEDLLFELGMLRRREDGGTYPMFRERIMIPVRNRWGRVIAYTARYIGTNPQAPKYINSATSIIYAKGETLFGMDRAFRMKNSDNYIIVEGAPDVLRMQSVGVENTVASLGIAWNENQFDLLKNYTDALRQYGLFIRNNCYFALGDDDEDPVRISNFVMEPLFHIEDESNGVRLFRLRNFSGQCRIIELKESELCSLTNFQQKAGSLGNYVWLAKIDKLNRVKEFLYARTDTAERIRKLGWNASEGFFAFGNGLFADGSFHPVDNMGIVRRDTTGKAYYIPATSQIFYHNPEIYQFERLMVHINKSGVLLRDYVEKLTDVFGDNARIAFCFLVATLFRDIIYKCTRHFPILDLFGEKGTGKTTLATSLQSFFLHDVDPPNLGVTSVPAMNDRVSQAVNTLVVFDEYKNDLDVRKIAFLKGLWGGGGQTKKNTLTDGMATQTIVTTGVVVCGQEKPTQDMALYTRVLFLAYTKTSFSYQEKKRYEELQSICGLGLTHLTLEILRHRELFEKNFPGMFSITKSELASRMDKETIHDRIFGNWIIPLATFRTLESVLDLPFGYAQMLETTVAGMRNQNELAQESSEVADFWNMLQGWQSSGKCVEKVHYRIRYLTRFRPMNVREDMEFMEARPILYLNMAAISSLFSSRNSTQNITANRSSWSTILSYLKSHASFLGLKQDRFSILLPNGTPDYTFEQKDGKMVKSVKVNRPKALCFDYLQLKEAFGMDLETEVVAEGSEEDE